MNSYANCEIANLLAQIIFTSSDIDECKIVGPDRICTDSLLCVNSPGSYKCLKCPDATKLDEDTNICEGRTIFVNICEYLCNLFLT